MEPLKQDSTNVHFMLEIHMRFSSFAMFAISPIFLPTSSSLAVLPKVPTACGGDSVVLLAACKCLQFLCVNVQFWCFSV